MGLFAETFESGCDERAKFLSRVFGIFSEKVMKLWFEDPRSPYSDLGRPTLYDSSDSRHTLDFTLQRSPTSPVYVAEMKCEIQYENFKYMTLEAADQIQHHVKGAAFQKFLRLADISPGITTKVDGREIDPAGAILVWGAVTEQGRAATIDRFGLHDVISAEDAIADLQKWGNTEFASLIRRRADWMSELANSLTGTV